MQIQPTPTPPPQPGFQRDKNMGGKNTKTLVILLVAVVAGAASIVAIILINGSASSCTVGVYGYAANMTFSGSDANKICSNFKTYGFPQSNGSTLIFYDDSNPQGTQLCAGKGQIYDMSAQPAVPAGGGIPTYPMLTTDFTVRDTGALMLIGNYLCSFLQPGSG